LPHTLKGAHKISDFITRQQCHSLEAYQEFLKPTGVDDTTMLAICSGDNHKMLSVAERLTHCGLMYCMLYHPWEKFTERDRLVLNLLQPHLTQAYQNAIRWQEIQQQLTQLQQSIEKSGVVFLDSVGRVELLTSQAANWLRSYFPSHNNFTELPELLQSWVKHQLAQFNGTYDLPDCCLPLHVQQGNRRLTIRLVIDRLGARYLLLLAEERVRSLLNSLELLGLSPREAEVLLCIIQGQNNKAIAMELGINVSTVRKHLENIYGKLGAQSRTEAIAVALEKLGILN
jgi:DNA-binding CsgD family transcriptional regulator